VDEQSSSRQKTTESSDRALRRVRRKRKPRSQKVKERIAGRGLRLAAFILLLFAILIWFVPLDERFEIVKQAVIIGVAIAFVAILVVDFRNRYRSNQANFVSSGCPQCGYEHLKRMERKKRDRIVGQLFGVPLRRYICPECHWKGTRVNEEYL
jgi:L-asparagine transporter-like permease